MGKIMEHTRINGLRTKKDGSKVQTVSYDIPVEIVERLEEIKEKTGISKNFLVAKALKLLILSESDKNN
ncbi:MAG: hypothetical protein WC445_04885 [Patescibacteria group bacterium]